MANRIGNNQLLDWMCRKMIRLLFHVEQSTKKKIAQQHCAVWFIQFQRQRLSCVFCGCANMPIYTMLKPSWSWCTHSVHWMHAIVRQKYSKIGSALRSIWNIYKRREGKRAPSEFPTRKVKFLVGWRSLFHFELADDRWDCWTRGKLSFGYTYVCIRAHFSRWLGPKERHCRTVDISRSRVHRWNACIRKHVSVRHSILKRWKFSMKRPQSNRKPSGNVPVLVTHLLEWPLHLHRAPTATSAIP